MNCDLKKKMYTTKYLRNIEICKVGRNGIFHFWTLSRMKKKSIGIVPIPWWMEFNRKAIISFDQHCKRLLDVSATTYFSFFRNTQVNESNEWIELNVFFGHLNIIFAVNRVFSCCSTSTHKEARGKKEQK